MPTIALNRQARHNFEILETYEAGIVLKGYEVKAIKTGLVNLKGSYISLKKDEETKELAPYLVKAHVGRYKPAGDIEDYSAERDRKLLLTRKEIGYLLGKSQEAGLTLVPLKLYTKHSFIKLEIGLVRGKKQYDKREDIKKRELDRRFRALKKEKFRY
ncbi:MAG: SsrA-binding protein SmpB [Candidatus Pacebacteria bacterium]|nr:SsrA-binding protein SmpB [Candidatus Paceibacterota bacterium]